MRKLSVWPFCFAIGLRSMKLQVEVALACFVGLICFQLILCDEAASNSPGINKWTCSCSANKVNQSIATSTNCSSSCNCNPGALTGDRWTCICAAGRFPEVVGNGSQPSCFTSCNCSSGSLSESEPSKKRYSSTFVAATLLLCVVVTTIVVIALVLCYFCQRDKITVQLPLFSSDKEISYNSATNLISHRATSVPESKIYVSSPANPIAGCFHKASILFRPSTRTIHGTITQYPYSELENATNKFSDSNVIGFGGSSHVYCGHLKDGKTVAVKRIKAQGGPDAEVIFLTEIELISRLHHCHVVPLLGYCLEYHGKHAEMLLVFQYMPNGNLRECLDGKLGKCLDWSTRVAIALGAARGLEYLHDAAAPRILHRDVKSTNILLDQNWRAKITDLGMAKSLRTDGLPSCSSSPARMQGTFGYFAPEYAIVGRASSKSDVFSFGVVLLELITGRHAIHKSIEKGEESLVIWATPRLQDSRRVIEELPDSQLEGKFQNEEMHIMAYLAKECLLLDPDSRPTMSEVVQVLSTIAPDNSRRRNFSIELVKGLSSPDMNSPINKEISDKQIQCRVINGELQRKTSERWSPRCCSTMHIDRSLCTENSEKEEIPDSAEFIERLILLTSNARSWRAQDDDAIVDLTEPRLESFCVVNAKSPS